MKLFSYGSIILPDMMIEQFGFSVVPLKSVFIRGYKLELQNEGSKEYPDYWFILCKDTGKMDDLVPGFLVEFPDEYIAELDKWEGDSYKRTPMKCYTRELQEVDCQIYVKK